MTQITTVAGVSRYDYVIVWTTTGVMSCFLVNLGTLSILTWWKHLHDLIISADRWFSSGILVSSTSKNNHHVHDITELSSEWNWLYAHLRQSEPSIPTQTTNINHTQIHHTPGVENQMVTGRITLSYVLKVDGGIELFLIDCLLLSCRGSWQYYH